MPAASGSVDRYFILTTRKRTIVALVHTVAFLTLALRGVVTVVPPLHRTSPASGWIMPSVYLAVSSVLLLLTARSRNARERLYFACCATSAGFGLARQVAGDPRMHAAAYIRVAMLLCAVIVGSSILRGYQPAPAMEAETNS